ncbi:hypothetical protein BST61_g2702 [Cercospora zeina]
MAPYRPPGRSNRSGRSNADNDVFEGLPVKQWNQAYAKVSLAPPVSEIEAGKDDKWGEPPMPRDFQLLNPWTQHLLRLARSGKVGTKRKQDADADDDKPDDEVAEEDTKPTSIDDRGYVAKKWKPVPEHSLEPEHKHFNFLAKRRRGLPSLYGPDLHLVSVPMRKTKVQKADANGEIVVYEVLVPEGQTIDGEIAESTELADVKPVLAAPGTVIEGVGVANEEGVMVAEHLKPSMPRRNRPPPKKKGGPGRGKKRVTFTNPDGSTYTAIVPNATKIVPQPGQTIKHVAKGEEAMADISAEQAARNAAQRHSEGVEDGSGDEDEEGDDDDDDREDGELSDDDAPATRAHTPAKAEGHGEPQAMEDVQPTSQTALTVGESTLPETKPAETPMEFTEQAIEPAKPPVAEPVDTLPDPKRSVESSPDLPLAQGHSRGASLVEPAPLTLNPVPEEKPIEVSNAEDPIVEDPIIEEAAELEPNTIGPDEVKPAEAEREREAPPTTEILPPLAQAAQEGESTENFDDGDEDLLGNLEKSLGRIIIYASMNYHYDAPNIRKAHQESSLSLLQELRLIAQIGFTCKWIDRARFCSQSGQISLLAVVLGLTSILSSDRSTAVVRTRPLSNKYPITYSCGITKGRCIQQMRQALHETSSDASRSAGHLPVLNMAVFFQYYLDAKVIVAIVPS